VDDLPAVIRTLLVGVAAYVALIVALRVSGKRTLTKWNAFDFVVTIALGSVLATTLTSNQVALAQGVTAFVVLIALQFVITWLSVRSRLVRRWTKSRPRLLLRHGRIDERALKDERVTRGEVLAAVRGSGIGDLERVDAVVLETDGSVSVIADTGAASALADVDGAAPEPPASQRAE
jgi:uncharacterized membrane protein YcaP (DUF421 family)